MSQRANFSKQTVVDEQMTETQLVLPWNGAWQQQI